MKINNLKEILILEQASLELSHQKKLCNKKRFQSFERSKKRKFSQAIPRIQSKVFKWIRKLIR